MSVDRLKLNIPGMGGGLNNTRKSSSVSSQATRNLGRSTSAGTSSSFQLNGRRSPGFVAGEFVSKGSNKLNYSAQREYFNSSGATTQTRSYTPSYGMNMNQSIMYPYGMQANSSTNFPNSMRVGMQIGKETFNFLNNIGVINLNKGDTNVSNSNALNNAVNSLGGNSTVSSSSSLSGQLSSVGSFSQLNSLEQTVSTKKANMNSSYQEVGTEAQANVQDILAGEGVQDGLSLAGVSLNANDISVSSLDSNNLEQSIKTVEQDITNIGQYKTTTLPNAKSQVTSKSGQVSQAISAKNGQLESLKANNKDGQNDAQIAKLEQEIEQLKEQQEQLKNAESAIDQISQQCEDTISSLESKKAEIKDLKQFEDQVKDKKYNLAKSQDKELKEAMDKITKLDKQIKDLEDKDKNKYNSSDDRRENKTNTLISQRKDAYSNLSKLTQSLSAAGATEFTNSKGATYKLQNLTKAINMGSS